MHALEKNLNVLRARDPQLADRLAVASNMESTRVQGKSGDADQLDKLLSTYPKLVILDGVPPVQTVESIYRYAGKNNARVILIEHDLREFYSVLAKSDISHILGDPHWQFIVDVNRDTIPYRLREIFLVREYLVASGRIGHLHCRSALVQNGDYYLYAAQTIQNVIAKNQSIFMAPAEDAYRGLRNTLKNMTRNDSYPASLLKNRCLNELGIVASAGPSLDLHIQYLKNSNRAGVVAATDGALKSLHAAGIKPDLVFCIERVAATKKLFEGLPGDYNVPLVTLNTIDPQSLAAYPGPVIFVGRTSTFGKWVFPDEPLFDIGSNVAIFAMRMLVYMGCKKIALIGQDLAFSRINNASHASGVADVARLGISNHANALGTVEVKGNDGTPIMSTPVWAKVIQEFEFAIKRFGITCLNVIASSAGAMIPSAQQVNPDEFWRSEVMHSKRECGIQECLKKSRVLSGSNVVLISKTQHYLHQMEKRCLALMDDVSGFQHDNLPSALRRDQLGMYGDYFKKIENEINLLLNINREYFDCFLFPLISSGDIQIMAKFVDMLGCNVWDENSVNSVIQYIQAWLEFVHHWISRALNLIENCGDDAGCGQVL